VAQLKNLKNNYMAKSTSQSFSTKSFTPEMLAAYSAGQTHRKGLSQIGNKISTTSIKEKYPHVYISSDAGLGKTYEVNSAMAKNKVKHYCISGNMSMFAFGVQLATINHLDPKSISIISVDDCDEILRNEANINIMKNVLDGAKTFHYQKHLGGLISQLDPLQQSAVERHQKPGVSGFVVPTDRMIFVFTSNTHLPHQDDPNKNNKTIHLKAIADRCRVYEIALTPEEKWGWITDVAANTNAIDSSIPRKIVEEATMFMWENWDCLTKKSIRTLQMMCDDYVNDPKNYKKFWEAQYVK
jgi:hypothetical protein